MTEQFSDDELRRIASAENTAHDATHRRLATALLAARPREITTAEELDALPVGSVILFQPPDDSHIWSRVWQCGSEKGYWDAVGAADESDSVQVVEQVDVIGVGKIIVLREGVR